MPSKGKRIDLRHDNRKDLKRPLGGRGKATVRDAKQYRGRTEVKKHKSLTKTNSTVLYFLQNCLETTITLCNTK